MSDARLPLPKLPPITVGAEVLCRIQGQAIIPGYPFYRVACKTLCGTNDCIGQPVQQEA